MFFCVRSLLGQEYIYIYTSYIHTHTCIDGEHISLSPLRNRSPVLFFVRSLCGQEKRIYHIYIYLIYIYIIIYTYITHIYNYIVFEYIYIYTVDPWCFGDVSMNVSFENAARKLNEAQVGADGFTWRWPRFGWIS